MMTLRVALCQGGPSDGVRTQWILSPCSQFIVNACRSRTRIKPTDVIACSDSPSHPRHDGDWRGLGSAQDVSTHGTILMRCIKPARKA
ncbi:hypothetical protein [uncultured Xanthomonas sp.]|uniref:hypothetical protein n=1 Tax=uncultured Xanthomonas sp. TaxID=152831 RepID=UPI0025E571E4|nr:hypothetical protein [uncultured Xanthomonas sp.]